VLISCLRPFIQCVTCFVWNVYRRETVKYEGHKGGGTPQMPGPGSPPHAFSSTLPSLRRILSRAPFLPSTHRTLEASIIGMGWLDDIAEAFSTSFGLGGSGGGEEQTKLLTSGTLTSEVLIRFFEASEELFDNPDFLESLKQAVHEDYKKAVKAIDFAQEKIFESLGVQGKFGMECLGKVMEAFKDDPIFLLRFNIFVSRENLLHSQFDHRVPAMQLQMMTAGHHAQSFQQMLMYKHAKALAEEGKDGKAWVVEAMSRNQMLAMKAMQQRKALETIVQTIGKDREKKETFLQEYQEEMQSGNKLLEGAAENIDKRFIALNVHAAKMDRWLQEKAKEHGVMGGVMSEQDQQKFMMQQFMMAQQQAQQMQGPKKGFRK